jgi:putative transposase
VKLSKFSKIRTVTFLKEADLGIPLKELIRRHWIRKCTFYNWMMKYNGMNASTLKQPRPLKEENRRLAQIHVDINLEHKTLMDIVEKKL